jgi:hypothetical protein
LVARAHINFKLLEATTFTPIEIVVTGLDPVIHLLRKKIVTKMDGCPDQVRA